MRQRTEFDVADYDLTFRSGFPSEGETRRVHARTQTDLAASATIGITGGVEWLGERGSSTFITAGTAGPAPVERSVLGVFGEARWQPAGRDGFTWHTNHPLLSRDFSASYLAHAAQEGFCDYYSCECLRDVKRAREFGFKGRVIGVFTNSCGFNLEQVSYLR